MKINIDHAENALQLLIFLPEKPNITERKAKTYLVKTFCKVVIVVAAISIFKSKVHDAVLVIIKAMFEF